MNVIIEKLARRLDVLFFSEDQTAAKCLLEQIADRRGPGVARDVIAECQRLADARLAALDAELECAALRPRQ
jgi:hypothetical protein